VSSIGKIATVFSFRRISGQIAALILASLFVIHALIAGYFLFRQSEPRLLADQPLPQFELFARIIAQTPRSDRRVVLQNIDRAFPRLQLTLKEDDSDRSRPPDDPPRPTIPSPLGGLVEIVPGFSANEDMVLFHLPDGQVLEAMIGSPKLPPFISGLWTSTLLFLFVSITLLAVWAGSALSSPLSAFARAAESFSLNRSSAPLPETGPEEIRAAAKALNRMRDRTTMLMNDRTRMLAAISHDLRTPITRLRLRSEYIEDEAQRAQTLRDLDQMQSMLESVLSLLRGGSAGNPTLVDAAALLQMICEQFSDCGHAVTYEGPDRVVLMMRPEEIIRAVTNLVENAVRFGTVVTVRLAVSSDQASIEVSDNGPGIPDERKSAMLEPFVRGEEARTMDEASGFGLGLSIAQAVVHAHGGTLSLHDNDSHGLLTRIVIPKNETLKD
jgi:signal transduction histidine kinase